MRIGTTEDSNRYCCTIICVAHTFLVCSTKAHYPMNVPSFPKTNVWTVPQTDYSAIKQTPTNALVYH
jgi:hypothetical protein